MLKGRQFDLTKWFENNPLGQYLKAQEMMFFQKALKDFNVENILHLGQFSDDLKDLNLKQHQTTRTQHFIYQSESLPADILAMPLASAWAEQTFDLIILAHQLDKLDILTPDEHSFFWQEIHRILRPNGVVVLTAFNPYSLWRLAWGEMPNVCQSVSLSQTKSHLNQQGFQVIQGQFINYLPPIASKQVIHYLDFMEKVGNRWFPHGSAVYGLMARKQMVQIRPLHENQSAFEMILEPNLGLTRDSSV